MEKIITSLRICKIIKDLKGNDTLRGDGNAYLSANGKASNN